MVSLLLLSHSLASSAYVSVIITCISLLTTVEEAGIRRFMFELLQLHDVYSHCCKNPIIWILDVQKIKESAFY